VLPFNRGNHLNGNEQAGGSIEEDEELPFNRGNHLNGNILINWVVEIFNEQATSL
jgi:hypothetical protein